MIVCLQSYQNHVFAQHLHLCVCILTPGSLEYRTPYSVLFLYSGNFRIIEHHLKI